ncbi:MAG: TetR/AcrR family transcriptional regulator [Lachnospiraceae bacterium]|nr:TetR/AcrR family transcriptional regulator [Lachnospiraceae bacterium]
MARRKKEPQSNHRKNIAEAAQRLFTEKGIESTSMNEIAKESGYSKATLYVYFKDKEELVGVLVLESMQKLYDYLRKTLEDTENVSECFYKICNAFVDYQEEYPFYFELLLKAINVDFETTRFLPEEKETFLVGERINALLIAFFEQGIERGIIRGDLDILPTIFALWGMISGVIMLSVNKQEYISMQMKKTKRDFLKQGFDLLYQSILSDKKEE